MRSSVIALLLALVPAIACAGRLAVSLDQSVRLTLSTPAQDVIVGNPDVASVQVADSRHLVITGKKYGVTNLIVTNGAGRTIYNGQLIVSAPDVGRVSVYEGPVPVNYACAPRCTIDAADLAGVIAPLAAASRASAVAAPQASPAGIQASPTVP